MVFWSIYPFINIVQAKCNTDIFKSLLFKRISLISPTGFKVIIIHQDKNQKYIPQVRDFLKNTFGSPPTTPILDIPEDELLKEKDHILIVKDIDKNIIGCVRYHFIGVFKGIQEMYCVDCLAVKKEWRKRGITDYLLTTLHNYVNLLKIPYSIFLKEGKPISQTPFYSGMYVFRKLQLVPSSKNVVSLSVSQAYNLMDIFLEFDRNIFVIRNSQSRNQFWKLYKKDTNKVLVCFQNTYQQFEEDGEIKKMCWVTAWIESPNITDKYREEASKELSDLMYPDFDYVWMPKKWSNSSNTWKTDGYFHWYLYQWTTSLSIKNSFCILN